MRRLLVYVLRYLLSALEDRPTSLGHISPPYEGAIPEAEIIDVTEIIYPMPKRLLN